MIRPPGEVGETVGRFTEADRGLATGEAVLVLPHGASGRIIIDHLNEMMGGARRSESPRLEFLS